MRTIFNDYSCKFSESQMSCCENVYVTVEPEVSNYKLVQKLFCLKPGLCLNKSLSTVKRRFPSNTSTWRFGNCSNWFAEILKRLAALHWTPRTLGKCVAIPNGNSPALWNLNTNANTSRLFLSKLWEPRTCVTVLTSVLWISATSHV